MPISIRFVEETHQKVLQDNTDLRRKLDTVFDRLKACRVVLHAIGDMDPMVSDNISTSPACFYCAEEEKHLDDCLWLLARAMGKWR